MSCRGTGRMTGIRESVFVSGYDVHVSQERSVNISQRQPTEL